MSARSWPHLYRVLDVHHEAGAEEIQDAFLARLAEVRGDAARMAAVADAWTVLGDPAQRAAYDRRAMVSASPANRELAAAVRPLAVWLGTLTVAAVVVVCLGFRDPYAIVGAGVLVACAPSGWRVVGRPLRWLELDLIRAAWLLRGVLAIAIGPYVAPVLVGWPLLRWSLVRLPALAPRLRELAGSVRAHARSIRGGSR